MCIRDRPENVHHRAMLLQMMRLVEVMTPDQQMLVLRLAESIADQTDQGSINTLIMQAASPVPVSASVP